MTIVGVQSPTRCSSSLTVQRKLTGVRTAPVPSTAIAATHHSSELCPARATTSPGPTPCSSTSPAATRRDQSPSSRYVSSSPPTSRATRSGSARVHQSSACVISVAIDPPAEWCPRCARRNRGATTSRSPGAVTMGWRIGSPGMGRPAVITKQRVAEVTLRLIDEEGLDAVSIERIGAELGVRGPSLYHHFTDKAEILTEVARLVLGDLEMADRPSDDWQQWLVDTSLLLYRRVLEHPQAALILMQFLPDASAIPGFGHAARLLTRSGVDPTVQVLLMEGCEKLVWGWSLQR